MSAFSDLLSNYIRRVGVPDAELARGIKVSRQTIHRWREGKSRPRYREHVLNLAKCLRLTDDERDKFLLAAGFNPETLEPDRLKAKEEALPTSKIDILTSDKPAEISGDVGLDDESIWPLWVKPFSIVLGAVVIIGLIVFGVNIALPPDPAPIPTSVASPPAVTGTKQAALAPTSTLAQAPITNATPTLSGITIAPAEKGESLILVTHFENFAGTGVGYNVPGRLIPVLEGEIARIADLVPVRLEVWPEEISRRQQALQAGQAVNATLVIYGQYDTGWVVAQFAYPVAEQKFIEDGVWHEVSDIQSLSATINRDLSEQIRPLALLILGQIYLGQGQTDDARNVLKSAQRILGAQSDVNQETLGTLNFFLGLAYGREPNPRYNDAILAYSEALKIRPALISARLNRSNIYHARRKAGDLELALQDINRVIAADKDWAAAYNNRAAILIDLGTKADLGKAKDDLDQALRLNPEIVSAYINRSLLLFNQGQPSEVWAPDLEEALSREPDRAGALNMLCWGYAIEGKADEGIIYCERALMADPRPHIYDSRGLANALLGETEQAIADFQVYIDWLADQPGEKRRQAQLKREAWIKALKAGENPFTAEVLADLRGQ